VSKGGHHVPDEVVQRRYHAGLRNFFELYWTLATTWRMYDNSGELPHVIATGDGRVAREIAQPSLWKRIRGH
jgi:predicted ABC-type ATPase